MRTLSLLRHAKSSWADERLADFDRPLAERGRKAAPRMGRQMRRIGLAPDRVLCSPAVRTRETAALVLAGFGRQDLAIDYDPRLYEADAETLLARLKQTDDSIQHLLLIGHNPGLQELALLLSRDNHAPNRAAIAEKLPTGSLVVLELAAKRWRDVRAGQARIAHFTTPRMLADE